MSSFIKNIHVQLVFLCIIIIFVDQITKLLVINFFDNRLSTHTVRLTFFFNITLAWNYGISFGIFNSSEQNQIIFLVLSTCFIMLFLYCYLRNLFINKLSIALIISGAIGNIIDRIHHGAVVDFIDFHLYDHHWPAFNIADTAIVIGAFLMIFFNEALTKRYA